MIKIHTKEELEKFAITNLNEINSFLDEQFKESKPQIYNSVDIRESSKNFAPVDNNIYPAGFNNLCQLDLDYAAKSFAKIFKEQAIKTCLIYPESNTKNKFYLDHLAILKRTLDSSGIETKIGSLDENIFQGKDNIELLSHSNYKINIEKLILDSNLLKTSTEVVPDLILLNNDQSQKIDIDWTKIENIVSPSPLLGWYQRSKGCHFLRYKQVVDHFSRHFEIDPGLLQADFMLVEDIDFNKKQGIDQIVDAFTTLKERNPDTNSFFVKAAQGTYGMGITIIKSIDDILSMNRKTRNKMDIGKNNKKFDSVIIQQGIDTVLTYESMPAEISLYMIAGKPVGGFMRANSVKSSSENLNSKGMVFKKFCISELKENSDHLSKEAIYSIIARLSALASAKEEIEKC